MDVNDAPTLESASFSIAEDLAVGSNIGTPLAATDIDVNSALTFSLVGGNDNGKFAINNSGQLRLIGALDYETATSYQLMAQVTDGDLSASAQIAITVTDVLDGTDKVISNINDAIENNDTSSLTVAVYESLGITGVTDDILALVNARISTIPASELPLTSEQIQAIVDEVTSLHIINQYSVTEGSSAAPLIADFTLIKLNGVDDENLARVLAALQAAPQVRTVPQLQQLIDGVISLTLINDLVTSNGQSTTPVIADFTNLGVENVTDDNLAAVLAKLAEASGELTAAKIQQLVDEVNGLTLINDFVASNGQSTAPVIADFTNLGVENVTDDNLAAVLERLALADGELSSEQIQAIVDEIISLALINQYSLSQGSSETPSLTDFDNISIHSLTDDVFTSLLIALRDNPALRTIDDIKALIASLAQGDSDNDGLSNELEASIGSDPNNANSPVVDGALDSDGDGVTNAVEAHLESLGGANAPLTTPSTDTDGDGLPDGLELANGFDPIDANSPTVNGASVATNGLTDAVNAYLTTLGLDNNGVIDKFNDFDNDGYNDALELLLGGNPLSAGDSDVDLDGVPDVVESYLTSTIDDGIDTKTLDLNSNGLSDAYEVRQAATLTELRELLAATEVVDSDNDGVPDAVESFITGDENDLSVTATSDSDNDGIADVDEILAGSNPRKNDIPVLWIESSKPDDNILMLETYFGGLPSSKVTYVWQLDSLTDVGMTVSATDIKQPQVTNLVGGLYPVSVTVTRDLNGELLTSSATYVVNITDTGALAVQDSDGDGVADSVDTDNGNTGAEEKIPTRIESDDTFKMTTDNGVKLRLGVVAILSGQNGSEITEENIQKFGNGQGQPVSQELSNDNGFEHLDTFDYEALNLPQAGASINVFIPLSVSIPEQATLRKFNATDGWKPYDVSGGDMFASSAAISAGVCSNNVDDYISGLTVGHDCLLLVITDGGANDSDGVINGMIQDPVAISAPEDSSPVTPTPPPVEPEPTYETGTKGGTTSLMILLILMLVLGRLFIIRPHYT